MKTKLAILLFPFLAMVSQAQAPPQRPWQEITVPSTGEVAANFKAPPRGYGAIQPFQSWNGTDPAEVRQRIKDLAPGGGYGVSSGAGVTRYVSLENFNAMREATFEYGKYPIRL